ncbi:carbon-nitrogen hydrolase family protein [Galbibacter sp. PAP.153]|uniref:carbon-nitrogen hydrolase family protein n=1 Tax=Galbibacter sp. PAP.153 TaxID=3104623 RepID=UPI00300B00B5
MKHKTNYSVAILVLFFFGCFIMLNTVHSQSESKKNSTKFKVAAAQLTPVYMDREKSLEKACKAIIEAGKNGAKLVVFPEAFIPGYPEWVWHTMPSDWEQNSEMYVKLVNNAVAIPSPTTNKLCEAARQANINVVIGIDELNTESSNATIYNTILFISDKGVLLGKHRKLVPTGAEKMVWARGDANTLQTYNTSVGKLSGLICYENKMPLARMALYNLGTQIMASPTADDTDSWLATVRSNASEGGMYVINVCSPGNRDWIPDTYEFKKNMPKDWSKKGNSCIIGPGGHIWKGPVENKETIIYCDILIKNIIEGKRMFDVAGNYSRPDVFKFSVKEDEK